MTLKLLFRIWLLCYYLQLIYCAADVAVVSESKEKIANLVLIESDWRLWYRSYDCVIVLFRLDDSIVPVLL